MLAPYVRIGKQSVSSSSFGRFRHACGALPSSVFEAERPGCKFTLQQRISTYFYKGFLYGSVGFGCGLIGQGIANLIMTAKKNIKKSEEDIPVPLSNKKCCTLEILSGSLFEYSIPNYKRIRALS